MSQKKYKYGPCKHGMGFTLLPIWGPVIEGGGVIPPPVNHRSQINTGEPDRVKHALEVMINILDTNFHVLVTYRFRNLTYLVILIKNVYFRLVKLHFFTPKSQSLKSRFNMP